MKRHILLILIILTTLNFCNTAFANINAIELDKISYFNEIKEDLNFVIENQHMFNHWDPNWSYELSKKEALTLLKNIQELSATKAKNIEELLLTGILSHYRYNLEDEDQFSVAESFFKKAIALDFQNYKPHWFLGNHYAHSGKPEDAVSKFFHAEKHNINIKAPEFWHDYSFAFYLAGMLSHSMKGLNQARILGKPSIYEETFLTAIKDKLKKPETNKQYNPQEFWDYKPNGKIADFTSRAFGVKFSIDTTWNYNVSKYSNKTAVVMINPKAEKNAEGRAIDYSIMLMMHIPEKDETIQQYAERFIAKYQDKKASKLNTHLNANLSYEIIDKEMYAHIGGAHIQFMALEKEKPLNPGLKLENAISLPKQNSEQSETVSFYRLKSEYDRFDNNIQYILILDTCEDIYEKSLKVYSKFLDTLIIE